MEPPKKPLPEFKFPPVTETVLGVQFDRLQNFSALHCGMFWEKVRSDYPKYSAMPPLGEAFEEFSAPIERKFSVGMEMSVEPPCRYWLMDESTTRLIQIQPDRFITNWRQVKGDEEYIRYTAFKPTFEKEWQRFSEFLRLENFSSPAINQCEVLYVNHIELNNVVRDVGTIDQLVKFWTSQKYEFLPGPEMIVVNMNYVMPGERGRLHVTLEPKIRTRDRKVVLQLSLLARGKPVSSDLPDVLDWFDMGREWIVRGFTELTTEQMHTLWERL